MQIENSQKHFFFIFLGIACLNTTFENSDASSVGITGVYQDYPTVSCNLGYVTEEDNDQLSYTTSCDHEGQWTVKLNCTSM